MIKTKKKNIHAPLVITGYVLFALLVIATLASTTIPFGLLLFNPKVMHVNVAVFLVAFTVGTLLPVVLGYIVGDHSIKTKNKLTLVFCFCGLGKQPVERNIARIGRMESAQDCSRSTACYQIMTVYPISTSLWMELTGPELNSPIFAHCLPLRRALYRE